MQSITLKQSLPSDFLSQLSNVLNTRPENNRLSINNRFISGHFTAFLFKNGIECMVARYRLKEDFHLHKTPSKNNYYILRIDEVQHAETSLVEVEGKYTSLENENYISTLLSSRQTSTLICSKNSRIKTIEIHIPAKWLENKIEGKEPKEMLFNGLKPNGIDIKFAFGHVNLKFFSQNITRNAARASSNSEIHGQAVYLLLEKYIHHLNEKLAQKANEQKTKIVKEEISRLIAVKDFLIKDLDTPPPSFSSLTSMAAMSGTSLKTKFKKMYGDNLFEFYQRQRMQKARVLLLSHHYSIKEIGLRMGYINLSNFSVAFKKEFGHLPSALSKRH